MDAAGKDSAVKHVMSGVNPQACQVFSFKAPSYEELDHDFLWRTNVCLPERGRIGIFNRILLRGSAGGAGASGAAGASETSRQVVGKNIWQWRFQSINALEQHLARNRTRIVKFHLRISKEEQRKRFLDRLDEPGKRWKFSMDDIKERALWDKYMDAYEDMIRATSTPQAPWYVVVEVAVWRLETS